MGGVTCAVAAMSGGAFRVVPVLRDHGDIFVTSGRLPKLGKSQPVPAPGSPFTEVVLCTHATCKLRSHTDPAPADDAPAPEPRPSSLLWRMPHSRVVDVVLQGAGFAVVFLSDKPQRKASPTDVVARLVDASPGAKQLSGPWQLRARQYVPASEYARDEWALLYRSVVRNYWHERLEASVVPGPEVYQWHGWATDEAGRLLQPCLSTLRLYVLRRDSPAALDADDAPLLAAPVAQLKRVVLRDQRTTVEVTAGRASTPALRFVAADAAAAFVLELQRVWEAATGVAGGGGNAAPFPVEEL